MRAFIAVDLPETIQAALGRVQTGFRAACSSPPEREDGVRWTHPQGIHLTLKFLGQISDAKVAEVSKALDMLGPFEKFSVEVKGFGFFPDARRPRVFWTGLEAPPALAQLANRVEESMAKLGFAQEARPFSPHLTLARFKSRGPQPGLEAALERERVGAIGRFEISEFFLFESRSSPRGPQYIKVSRFPRS